MRRQLVAAQPELIERLTARVAEFERRLACATAPPAPSTNAVWQDQRDALCAALALDTDPPRCSISSPPPLDVHSAPPLRALSRIAEVAAYERSPRQ